MAARLLLIWLLPGMLIAGAPQAADSLHVRLVGFYADSAGAGTGDVCGEYVYYLRERAFKVLSVVDPSHPVLVGEADSSHEVSRVVAAGDLVYAAGTQLYVFSVADRSRPVEIGCSDTAMFPKGLAVTDGYAYVGCDSQGLRVISIADPTHPEDVAHYDLPGITYDVRVVGDYLYVADLFDGLRILSVADPSHPVEVGYLPGSPVRFAVEGDYACVYDADYGLRVFSIADPAHPVEVGSLAGVGGEVEMDGKYVYVLHVNQAMLRVVSIVDSTNPVEVGHYSLEPRFAYLDAGRGLAYAGSTDGFWILEFYLPGDLDVDNDSLDVVADTVRLRPGTILSASSFRRSDGVVIGGISSERPLDSAASLGVTGDAQLAVGEFVLANTSAAYNPDTSDGPSLSVIDSVHFTGSLSGPGGTLDSILISNLPAFLAEGQVVVCSLVVFTPPGLRDGDYTGTFVISGKDTAGFVIEDTFYARLSKLGDLDLDDDSLDVAADTMQLSSVGSYARGEFVLVNTSLSHNPDTADGPSRSPLDAVSFSGSLTGTGGTLDSILIPNLPATLATGQAVICSLAVYVPVEARGGEYSGVVIISGRDTSGFTLEDSFYVRLTKQPGDLDVDGDTLDVAYDTMNLRTQPAGPVYHPYARARFMLVNTSSAYNPDTSDGPSQSKLRQVKAEAKVEGQNGTLDSVYVLNLPESLAVGQAVECTLAVVLPDSAAPGDYGGWVAISATDTLGYAVRDSFFLEVHGPEPRQSLDSLRVAPIPFKPYQNPEHDAIHFQGLSAGARVIVYDASGHSVWSATESGDGHLSWDAKVASGIYVYLVVSADGKSSKVGRLSVIR